MIFIAVAFLQHAEFQMKPRLFGSSADFQFGGVVNIRRALKMLHSLAQLSRFMC